MSRKKIIKDEFPIKNMTLPNLMKDNLNIKLYQTMCCAMRISKNVLQLIKSTSIEQNRLYFHELLLLSLVIHNNLSYLVIPELENIIYRKDWSVHTLKINPGKLFHPIKDHKLQKKIREYINYSR